MEKIKMALRAALLAMAPAAAAAQGGADWQGFWAPDPAFCPRAGQPGAATPDWYGRDGWQGQGWHCALRHEQRLPVGRSWLLRLRCPDAGRPDDQAVIFVLDGGATGWLIHGDGVPRRIYRCRKNDLDWLERG